MKHKRIFLMILVAALLISVFPASAFAAGASAKASPSSVNAGDTVTVKVTFSGKNIGAVQGSFSYDKSILKYVSGSGTSNGKIVLYTSSENASSLSTSIKFKALKAGKASVSVSASEVLSFDEKSLGTAKASASVTVKEKSSEPSPKPSASKSPGASASPSTGASPSVNPMENAIKVTIGEQALYIRPSLEGVTLPQDFKAAAATYQDRKIQVAASANITLAYLTDEKGENGAFYVLDQDALYPYLQVAINKAYTIVHPDSSVAVPQGYTETALKLKERSVQAWKSDKDPDFYLLYIINPEGKKDFYTYDSVEGTLQRYTDRTVVVEVEKEPAPLPPDQQAQLAISQEEANTKSIETLGFFEKLQSDSTLLIVFVSLAGLIVLLAAGITWLLLKKRKTAKHAQP